MQPTDKDKEIRNKINALSDIPQNIDWNVEEGWRKYRQKYRFSGKRKLIYLSSSVAAAILLIFMMLVIPDQQSRIIHFSTENEKKDIVLNDGSRIWLNHNSTLEIDQRKDHIKVTGEIYVELSGEDEYRISSRYGSFLTKHGYFNLKSRKNSNRSVLTVVEGEVEAIWEGEKKLKTIAGPGIQVDLISDVAMAQTPVDNSNFLAWKTGELHFNGTPLYSVIEKLEELNDIKIAIQNKEMRYCRINSKFNSISVDSVLKAFPKSLNLNVKRKDDQYFIAGEGCERGDSL